MTIQEKQELKNEALKYLTELLPPEIYGEDDRCQIIQDILEELASDGSISDEAKHLLEDYNQWEADIIMEDKLWAPYRAQDVLRGAIYDKMIELQAKRNDLLKRWGKRR